MGSFHSFFCKKLNGCWSGFNEEEVIRRETVAVIVRGGGTGVIYLRLKDLTARSASGFILFEEMRWLIGSAPACWGTGPGFESGISNNDPDALQDTVM